MGFTPDVENDRRYGQSGDGGAHRDDRLCGPDDVDRAVGAARAITTEMGSPYALAHDAKAECGPGYFGETIKGGARV